MIGLGTIINVAAIVAGGLIGLAFSRAISARYQETLMQAIGVCVIFVGISGAVQEMMRGANSVFRLCSCAGPWGTRPSQRRRMP